MFNIIFLIKSEYNNIYEEIYKKIVISNIHYDKIILFLEDNQKINIENNNDKIDIFNTNYLNNDLKYNNLEKSNKISFIINEICNKYHGLCTCINLSKINYNIHSSHIHHHRSNTNLQVA
jgi:hypothetical protein